MLATWSGVYDALTRLFLPVAITFVMLMALGLIKAWGVPATGLPTAPGLRGQLFEVARMFVATPYLFAVYRLIILGETAANYWIAAVSPAFWRFCGLSLAYIVVAYAWMTLPEILPEWGELLGHVTLLAFLPLAFPAMVLFPAVAVGAPAAGWRWAFATTRGHWAHMFLISLATILPFVIAALTVRQILQNAIGSDAAVTIATIEAITFPLGGTIGAVLASLVYQWIGTEKGLIPSIFE
jgi:hypothetical protein